MKNLLVTYIRGKNGQMRGCIVCTGKTTNYSLSNPYAFKIGTSFCNLKQDKFDKEIALQLAIERAENPQECDIPTDMVVRTCCHWEIMLQRARRYFK